MSRQEPLSCSASERAMYHPYDMIVRYDGARFGGHSVFTGCADPVILEASVVNLPIDRWRRRYDGNRYR